MTTNNGAQTIFQRASRAFFVRSPGVTGPLSSLEVPVG